jgi:hypothetical protein
MRVFCNISSHFNDSIVARWLILAPLVQALIAPKNITLFLTTTPCLFVTCRATPYLIISSVSLTETSHKHHLPPQEQYSRLHNHILPLSHVRLPFQLAAKSKTRPNPHSRSDHDESRPPSQYTYGSYNPRWVGDPVNVSTPLLRKIRILEPSRLLLIDNTSTLDFDTGFWTLHIDSRLDHSAPTITHPQRDPPTSVVPRALTVR